MAEISWASVVDKGLDHLRQILVLVFLILGVGLLLLAANKGYSLAHFSFTDNLVVNILGSIGLLLIIISIIGFFIRSDQPISLAKLRRKYGITIESPLVNSPVSSSIPLNGTFKRIGVNEQLHAFEYNPASQQYWPKGRLIFDHHKKTWRTTINIGGGDDQVRVLIIAYLGEGSQRLLDFRERVKQDVGKYFGIRQFPSDFYPLGQVDVILKRPPEKEK